jgi:hypothetical protein
LRDGWGRWRLLLLLLLGDDHGLWRMGKAYG